LAGKSPFLAWQRKGTCPTTKRNLLMILTLLLPVLEMIVNCALKADSDALAKVAPIQNQVIEIHCEDWEMIFYIVIDSQGLQFHRSYSGAANTIVRGTLNNFLHVFMKGGDTTSVFQNPIDITGDTHNIEVLRDAFKNLDIDFEEKLSHYLGDSISHKLFFRLKSAKNMLKKSADNITEQTKEFIHCETKNLVSHHQAEQFYTDIAKLRDDVERIEARIHNRLSHQQK
jgi:ubiquinone biosynthesis protein UbiJ